MVGKNPHRPEGKAPDLEHHAASRTKDAPYQAPSRKELHERDMESAERMGAPTRAPAEEPVGGSRPGVESRVKDAIARREERGEE